jgi:fatty-acyl-CoA synthase
MSWNALNKVACKAIVCAASFKSSEYLQMLQQLIPELDSCLPGQLQSARFTHLKLIIRMGDEVSPGMKNFADVHQSGGEAQFAQLAELANTLQPDEAINIQFTSGTTGKPKGATLTHFNILNNASQVATGMQLSCDDKLCLPVPLYHCFGMVMGNLACLTKGSCVVFPADSFEPVSVLQAVEEE